MAKFSCVFAFFLYFSFQGTIKLMTMGSVVYTPIVVKFSPMIQELLHITTK